uniref:Uncharacterized protein n=1 Tax=Oncorhynchus kisutch TaxID=8019 RepID=A0A8C7KP50_ONCKI
GEFSLFYYACEDFERFVDPHMGTCHCHIIAKSCICAGASLSTPLKAYVFREYNLQPTEPGVHSHYLGGYEHKMWQAVRASSAAMGHDLHQVRPGPALAIHECKCLWPNTSVQCVVSLGTGRVETAGKNNTTYTSLKTKLPNVITSATDTEEVHVMLDALLSPDLCLKLEKIKHGMYDGKPIFNCKL